MKVGTEGGEVGVVLVGPAAGHEHVHLRQRGGVGAPQQDVGELHTRVLVAPARAPRVELLAGQAVEVVPVLEVPLPRLDGLQPVWQELVLHRVQVQTAGGRPSGRRGRTFLHDHVRR